MIELLSAPSVYAQKVCIVLEETGLPYLVRAPDASTAGEASPPRPLGATPSLHDPHGPDGLPITIGESAAIALYLARKAHKLGPESAREMAEFDYWAHAISASLSPLLGFARYLSERAEISTATAIETSARRMVRVFEERMATRHFMAGERFTVLDALLYPHLAASMPQMPGGIASYPNLQRFRDRIGQREGVRRGMAAIPS